MDSSTALRTSVTLLGRLRQSPHDEEAWALFVQRYTPLILGWAREWRLQQVDAEEVTQIVLSKLVTVLKRFEYNRERGRFRGFLYKITRYACMELVSSPQFRERGKGGSEILAALSQREAQADLAERLARKYDLELRDEAYRLVQQRVKPRNWQAFWLRHVEEIPGAEVATRLGMGRDTVFGVAARVLRMINREIERLEAEELGHANLSP